MKKVFSLILIIISVASCTKIVDLNIPPHEEKSVCFSISPVNENLKLYINKTQNLFSINIDTLSFIDTSNKAYIIVNNSDSINFVSLDRGWFTAQNYKPNLGDNILLTVTNKSRKTATAKITVPNEIVNHSISFSYNSFQINDKPYSQLELTLSDPTTSENYYELIAKVFIEKADTVINHFFYEWKSFHPILVNEDLEQYEPSRILFSDKMFSGSQVSIQIFFPLYITSFSDIKRVKIATQLRNISKEYYEYKKSLTKAKRLDKDFFQGIQEPTEVLSNIKDGAGIFSIYTFSNDSTYYYGKK